MAGHPYHDFNTYLRGIYGCRVQKITVDAGLSCPNRDGTLSTGGCIYCNAKGSGTGAHGRGWSITDQVLMGKEKLARRYRAKKFLVYFQSFSNTYAPVSKLKALYDEALSIDDVVGLSIGTRPDCVNDRVLKLLEGYARNHLLWLEYGLQSAHDSTLRAINRGHDLACFTRAVAATRNRGIRICAHVILGLPHETRRHMLETADVVAGLDIDGIKLHLLYVIRGTRLEDIYRKKEFRCLEKAEYVDIVCDFLERIPWKVVIQRLTSDPHPEELVAPQWARNKAETIRLIRDTLAARGSFQGKRINGTFPPG